MNDDHLHDHHNDDDWRQVVDKFVEGQSNLRADQDVGRVADYYRGAPIFDARISANKFG